VLTSDSFGDGFRRHRQPQRQGPLESSTSRLETAGRVYVFSSASVPTFVMDGNRGVGAASGDLAEMFEASREIEAGSVVVIDPLHRGKLSPPARPTIGAWQASWREPTNYRSAIHLLRAMDGTLGTRCR
jgi:hypothetical protein